MLKSVFVLMLTCSVGSSVTVYKTGTRFKTEKQVNCTPIPEEVLSEILGPSYNSRYMSISKPKASTDDNRKVPENPFNKRRIEPVESFYVEDDYARDFGDQPAWQTKFTGGTSSLFYETIRDREKRAVMPKYKPMEKREPWQCEKKIHWLDLGPDYFPRYLRTVECTKHTCFYGHYRCKPRSFTVRLMRRKAGLCAQMDPDKKIGVAGLPLQLRELWVWEERAVNFCCECAAG